MRRHPARNSQEYLMSLTRLTPAVLISSVLLGFAPAQGKPFKHALPANTLMFVSAPDINTSIAEFESTAFAKMWQEEEVQDFVKDAMVMAQAQWQQGKAMLVEMHKNGQIPVSPDEIEKLRVHSMTAAMTSCELAMGPMGPMPKIGFLMHADFGESIGVIRKAIGFGAMAIMAEAAGMMEKTTTKLDGDIELLTLTPPGETGMSLNIAFVGNGLILGSITEEVTAAVAAVLGQKTILPDNPYYTATAKHVGTAGAEVEGYVNMAGYMKLLMASMELLETNMPEWPAELQVTAISRAMTALGANSMKAMGFASKYEGGKAVTRSFTLAPEAERKGFFSGASKAADLGFLKWVPKDVASVSTSTLDIRGIYDGMVGALRAFDPDMAEFMLGQLAEQEEMFGISLKDDLFNVFGGQVATWSMGVSSFMSAPEGAMILKVRDQERLLATLQKLAAMTGGMIDFPVSERRGVKTWRLEMDPESIPEEVAAGLQMLQPCFAFKDGYMVLALSTGDVRRTIKRMDREDDPATDIRSNKEFASYLTSLQQQKVSSFAWTDWKVTFESMYSAATSALALLVSDEDIPFNMTLLPEAESLSQHLFSSMSWSTTTEHGYLSTSISPIGPEAMMGLGAGVAAGAAAAMFLIPSDLDAGFAFPGEHIPKSADGPGKKKK
jgi:hypothetical protein